MDRFSMVSSRNVNNGTRNRWFSFWRGFRSPYGWKKINRFFFIIILTSDNRVLGSGRRSALCEYSCLIWNKYFFNILYIFSIYNKKKTLFVANIGLYHKCFTFLTDVTLVQQSDQYYPFSNLFCVLYLFEEQVKRIFDFFSFLNVQVNWSSQNVPNHFLKLLSFKQVIAHITPDYIWKHISVH